MFRVRLTGSHLANQMVFQIPLSRICDSRLQRDRTHGKIEFFVVRGKPGMNDILNLSLEIWTLIAITSGVVLLTGILATPWLLAMIPDDYFITHQSYLIHWKTSRPILRWFVLFLRNLVGVFLFLLGFLMLFTPGQGMVFILLGLSSMTFPGKRAIELKILRQKEVLSSINWLRQKMNRKPLRVPGDEPAKTSPKT